MAYKFYKNEHFESLILVAIIISSIKLVIDTYIDFNNPD